MTAFEPRASRSAMMALLSKALSAIKASKDKPSMSGATPTVSWRYEAHEIAERVRQSEDFGGHAAFGFANGLAGSPPFPPVRDGGL